MWERRRRGAQNAHAAESKARLKNALAPAGQTNSHLTSAFLRLCFLLRFSNSFKVATAHDVVWALSQMTL